MSQAHPTSPAIYLIGTQTLKAGGAAATISGVVVSLVEGGSSVAVGTITEGVSDLLKSTTKDGLGGVIASLGGFNTQAPPRTTSISLGGNDGFPQNGTAFIGSGVKARTTVWLWGFSLGTTLVAVGLL